MKAINCTQCGATIENVSERSVIVDCVYCGARMIMEPPRKDEPKPVSMPAPDFESQPATTFKPGFVAVLGAAMALIPIVIVVGVLMKSPEPEFGSSYVYNAPVGPSVYPASSSWSVSTDPPKPVPVVNYQPRVSWDGPNDMQYFADPEVDISTVSDLSSEEVKKTVFKNRVVKLRVVINTEGEIDDVETISGHPLLVAAATDSAKRSIFNSRSKPTTRVLTYTFRVLKD